MTQIAGGKYTRSNKFSSLNWTIAMIVAFFIAIGIGRLYALISIINPIIYLNFLLLAGVVILLAIIITLIKSIGKSRKQEPGSWSNWKFRNEYRSRYIVYMLPDRVCCLPGTCIPGGEI